jgi:hypothetical protein
MHEPPDRPEPNARQQSGGHPEKKPMVLANGSAESKEDNADSSSPGLIQLAICVAGIYASLYGPLLLFRVPIFMTELN